MYKGWGEKFEPSHHKASLTTWIGKDSSKFCVFTNTRQTTKPSDIEFVNANILKTLMKNHTFKHKHTDNSKEESRWFIEISLSIFKCHTSQEDANI